MNRNEIEHKIAKALQTEPAFRLSDKFSDKVVAQITRRQELEEKKEAYLIVAGIIGFLVLSIVSLLVYVDQQTLQDLMGISGWAVVVGLLVVAIQVLDKRLVTKTTSPG